MGILRTLAASTCAAAAIALGAAAPTSAAEHVVNGNFDADVCDNMSCFGGGWGGTTASAGPGINATGPRCGPLKSHCADDGSGYSTAVNWGRLGAASGATGISWVQSILFQSVSIPAGGTSTLRFVIHMSPIVLLDRHMTVKLDGTTVFYLDDSSEAAYATYKPVVIDVTAFGGATRSLEFIGKSTVSTGSAPGFDIDDISLQDTPAASAPVANATPTITPTTGQRAAALAKCKKKKGKARRKCKQKANALPL